MAFEICFDLVFQPIFAAFFEGASQTKELFPQY